MLHHVWVALLPILATGLGENTVYIIRHGEKKWTLGCLRDQGQARAQNLVNVFNGQSSQAHAHFGVPKAIFANWYDDPIDCERCLETISPLASSLGVQVDHTHGGEHPGAGPGGGDSGAALAVKAALRVTGGPVLVAWESANIHYLATELGVQDAPYWHNNPLPFFEDDYDSVWILSFDGSQNLTSFQQSRQHFQKPSQQLVPSITI